MPNNVFKVPIPQCNCDVLIEKPEFVSNTSFQSTTCSSVAFQRGMGQKVVGFSFYGNSKSSHHKSKQYFSGIVNNLREMPKYYPGWIMRLYYDVDPGDDILTDLCALACENPILELCDVQRLPGMPKKNASKIFPMNWRFFPTLDPQVDIFASRDLDSLFSPRESAAVSEWLASDKSFHMMRDHPEHTISMLGSGWGVKLFKGKIREKWRAAWTEAKDDPVVMWGGRNLTGPDQGFLMRYVWPWAKRDSLQHDSYSCKVFSKTVGFPTRRRNETNNFVASVVAQNMYIWKKCPLKCRRFPEWEFC